MNKIKVYLILSFALIFAGLSLSMIYTEKKLYLEAVTQERLEGLKQAAFLLPEHFALLQTQELEKMGFRVTLIDLEGEVKYDTLADYSDNLLYKMELKSGFAVRLDQEAGFIFAVKKIKEGYIRLGKKENPAFFDALNRKILLYSAVSLVILIILIWFFSGRILSSVKSILRFAKRIKSGNYKARIYIEGARDLELVSKSLNQMAETIESSHMELKLGKEMIESVIQNIPVGIALLDSAGRLEVFNPKLEILLNQSMVLGRYYYENFFHSQVIESIKEAFTKETDITVKIPMVNMERSAIYEVYCHYLDSKIIVMITDVTEKEKLSQLKNQFISDVTHEFKTPIAIMLGYLEVIEEKIKPEDQVYIQKIKLSLNRLTEIINDLVKLEKIEYSSLFGGFVKVSLKEVVLKVIDILNPFAEKKQIEIKTDFAFSPLTIHGIEEIIYYCIYNLVENSIKYNDKEKGILEIKLEEQNGKALIRVWDNGPGIPQEYREDIFRRFFRVSKSRTSTGGQGGSGLGLSIVREGMRFHKGNIVVKDSPLGEGICFELVFPLE